jgi:hypothetical protein
LRRGHRPGHHDQVPVTHNERRREQQPEHHDQVPFDLDAGASNRTTTGPRPTYTKAGTISADPPLFSVAAFVVNSEPHTGARPSVHLCVEPELARCVHIHLMSKKVKRLVILRGHQRHRISLVNADRSGAVQ